MAAVQNRAMVPHQNQIYPQPPQVVRNAVEWGAPAMAPQQQRSFYGQQPQMPEAQLWQQGTPFGSGQQAPHPPGYAAPPVGGYMPQTQQQQPMPMPPPPGMRQPQQLPAFRAQPPAVWGRSQAAPPQFPAPPPVTPPHQQAPAPSQAAPVQQQAPQQQAPAPAPAPVQQNPLASAYGYPAPQAPMPLDNTGDPLWAAQYRAALLARQGQYGGFPGAFGPGSDQVGYTN